MRCLLLSLSVVFVLIAVPAMAQSPPTTKIQIAGGGVGGAVGGGVAHMSMGEITPTSEMWFYQEQLRQYNDPKMSLRRIAEGKAERRRARLAAQRWYGVSNMRPTVGMDPVHGEWGARWTSGNRYYPGRFSSFGTATVVVRPTAQKRTY
jgi:hypothetical protein